MFVNDYNTCTYKNHFTLQGKAGEQKRDSPSGEGRENGGGGGGGGRLNCNSFTEIDLKKQPKT